MIKISKELLNEAIGNISDIYNIKIVNDYLFWDNGYSNQINIYELLYKCKCWALNKGYEIVHMADTTKVYKNRNEIYNVTNVKIYCLENFFEACEWILKELK